jgi:hypothetical protein
MSTPIIFEPQTITLTTTQGPYEVPATVGIETGLAYHKDPRALSSEGFTITAVNCGYAVGQTGDYTSIFNVDAALNEKITQHMIANIATVLDWTLPREDLIAQIKAVFKHGKDIRDTFREAFSKACEQVAAEQQQATAQEVEA